jgi:hypothetical protein
MGYLYLFGNIFERKLIYFGKNKSLVPAIHMKFLVLEQEKGKKSFKISFQFLQKSFYHKLD